MSEGVTYFDGSWGNVVIPGDSLEVDGVCESPELAPLVGPEVGPFVGPLRGPLVDGPEGSLEVNGYFRSLVPETRKEMSFHPPLVSRCCTRGIKNSAVGIHRKCLLV